MNFPARSRLNLWQIGFESLGSVAQAFLSTPDLHDLVQNVVNSVLFEVAKLGKDFHICVLALVEGNELKRIAMSRTEAAQSVRGASRTAFEDIVTPLSANENLCIKTMNDRTPYLTHEFFDILHPPYSKEKCERLQIAGGIKTSVVFPVIVKGNSIGILIFSTKQHFHELKQEEITFIQSLTGIVGIAVENSRLFEQVDRDKAELEKANSRLQELDKLKDEFVSIASHELRTPMVSIKNYLWMTLEGKGGKISRKQKFYLQRAYESANRMTKLVNDMLNISRIESGRVLLSVEKVNIQELIDQTIDELTPRAKQLEISVSARPMNQADKPPNDMKIPEVIADRDKIAEVLVNLLGNALKFTPAGKKIRMWSESDESKFVTIHVQDEGIGLTKEQIPKLFKKFGMIKESYQSNSEASQGTGLGLFICKSIVELHGGKIWVESDGHQHGAKFSFTLPIYQEDELKKLQKKFSKGSDAGIIRTNISVD